MIALKNGTTEQQSGVDAIMSTIWGLWSRGISGMETVLDLAKRCHNPACSISLTNQDMLKRLGLLEPDGSPHALVKNVLLSAAVGRGEKMSLGSPYDEAQ